MPDYGVTRQAPNVNVTAKKAKQFLLRSRFLLMWLGRPLFFLLIAIIIGFLAAIWIIGKGILIAFEKLAHWPRSIPRKLPPLSKPKILEDLPRIPVPSLVLPRLPNINISFLLKRVKLLIKLGIVTIVFLTISLLTWFFFLQDLPKPGELASRNQIVSTKIYARDGQLLYKIFRNQNRTLIPLEEIPLHTRQATIAIEDADFYSHPGFSLRGIIRAFIRNATRGEKTGGSTITQQLVKNALLSPEKTFTRKIKEVVLAIRVELSFSKDQILEMYLNEVAYGGATYGIEEASHLYFGKKARDLSLSESALLAGLPKAPTTYSPFGANPQLSRSRQLEVLARMAQEGYITQNEAQETSKERLVFSPQRTNIRAPHFVMHVRQLLAEKYGERLVEEGGLEVITSLDLELQEMVEKIVFSETEKIKKLRISNGAALVTNPTNGEILAMVGSKNYFDAQGDGNFNVTTALRQPGSSIKPVNYSYALESGGFTAGSIISDTPITYSAAGTDPYSPRNYDNRFHGRISLRTALASSYNVPAVKVLASYGVEKMIEQAEKMGVTTWQDPSNYGLSLTLGGGDIRTVDMNVVYGTLANQGRRVDLNPVLHVTDYRGHLLEENRCASVKQVYEDNLAGTLVPKTYAAEAAYDECGEQVLDPRVAFILTDILRDNSARIPAFGSRSLLVVPDHSEVAVKTGTTQNLRDNWAIGYTQDYVVSAWVGNNDNTPMSYVASGVTGATPIWHNIMKELLKDKSNHDWSVPAGIKEVKICPWSGTLPCEGCPTKIEYYLPGTEPTYHCKPEDFQKEEEGEENKEGQIL